MLKENNSEEWPDDLLPRKSKDKGGTFMPTNSNTQQPPQPQQQVPQTQPQPQVQEQPLESAHYAGFWIRFVAALIDGIILFVPTFFISLIFAVPSALMSTSQNTSNGANMGLLFGLLGLRFIANLIVLAINWTYFTIMTGKYGATLGKMALGIKVVNEDYEKPSYGTAAMREILGKFIDGFTFGIGYIIAGFTDKKQALHDYIAKTYVIYK